MVLKLNTLTATLAAELLTERRHFLLSGPTVFEGRPREEEAALFVRQEDTEAFNQADYVITSDRWLIAWHGPDGWCVPEIKFALYSPNADDVEFIKRAISLTTEWQNQGDDR